MKIRSPYFFARARIFILASLASLGSVLAPVHADTTPFQGRTVSEIEIQGLKRIEKEAVLGKISTKVNEPLDATKVQGDIRAIFSLGYFDDIAVDGQEAAGGKVKVTYQIKERAVIASLEFEGNEKIETDDLKEVVKIKEWAILDINLIREDAVRIQKHYEDKGFYLAKVDFTIELVEGKTDEVKLVFKIQDYDKVKIKKITFLNNKVFSDEQLKNVFQETKEGGLMSFMSGSGSFKDSSFKKDLQILTYWYLDHGYVKFRYENPVVTVSEDKKFLFISIYVEEGEPYNMGTIDFSGDLLFSKEELNNELTLKSDETFKISKRNLDIQKLTEKYQDLGYAFVNVIPNMKVNDDTKTVDIDYSFEKGNLVHFREIFIAGNSKTHDKVIRRELRITEGQLFSGSGLRKSRERVERLGYFAPGEVQFNTLTVKGRDDLVDIEIKIKERSTGTITLGAGYGSVQKFFFQTQVSEINLFGLGQTLSFQALYATNGKEKSFNLGFTEPYFLDSNWSTGLDFFLVTYPIPGLYELRKLGGAARFGRPLTDDLTAYITYKREGLQVIRDLGDNVNSELENGTLSSLVYSVIRDQRNNRFETTDGSYQSAALETAGVAFLGGNKEFMKMNVNNRYYKTLIGDLVFRNSTEVGNIVGLGDRAVPPSERFFLGGPNNMKGYDSMSLANEETVDGKRVRGGLVQMFSLFELEYPLIREAGVKWVGFYDVGNTFLTLPGSGKEAFILRHDVGLGIRWFSPIGPLRFEWGFPLNPRPGDSPTVFNFYIGPPF